MKMIVRLVCSVSIMLLAGYATAQTAQPEGWKFDTLTLSAGEDPLSSGITGSLWMKDAGNKRLLNIVVQHEQGWLVFGKQFELGKLKVDAAGSVGHFQGAPWAGPYLAASLPLGKIGGTEISASTLHWPGVYLWLPDGRKGTLPDGAIAIASIHSAQVNVGGLSFVFSGLKYLHDPWNPLPGIAYCHKVRKDFSISSSATRNVNAKRWMFYVGGTWSPGA
jgi:hypothetical protein